MVDRPGDKVSPHDRTPLIEVNVSHEHGPAPSRRQLTEAVEVITRNHIYVLDSGMTCISVLKASTRDPATESGFIGSRLVGGQLGQETTGADARRRCQRQ